MPFPLFLPEHRSQAFVVGPEDEVFGLASDARIFVKHFVDIDHITDPLAVLVTKDHVQTCLVRDQLASGIWPFNASDFWPFDMEKMYLSTLASPDVVMANAAGKSKYKAKLRKQGIKTFRDDENRLALWLSLCETFSGAPGTAAERINLAFTAAIEELLPLSADGVIRCRSSEHSYSLGLTAN